MRRWQDGWPMWLPRPLATAWEAQAGDFCLRIPFRRFGGPFRGFKIYRESSIEKQDERAQIERYGYVYPVDDIGPYGGLAVTVAGTPMWSRPKCAIHPDQPLAYVLGQWECPRLRCGYVEKLPRGGPALVPSSPDEL